ncbi:MAG: T9SS type A sorting domain-containing protein [bacterium]|nr:MAG: T9SS type A sorting domain-containing protein [bacterium]
MRSILMIMLFACIPGLVYGLGPEINGSDTSSDRFESLAPSEALIASKIVDHLSKVVQQNGNIHYDSFIGDILNNSDFNNFNGRKPYDDSNSNQASQSLFFGSLVFDKFFSNALNTMRAVDVYLPKNYNPDDTAKKYPVIYFLHGAGTRQRIYSILFKLLLDYHIELKNIKPVIFVLPDGSAPPYEGSFYTNSQLYGRFEDYIVQDLIDYIETKYHALSSRETRFIMGVSMGGYGAMKLAMKYPGIYRAVISHSGPLDLNQVQDFVNIILKENGRTPPYSYVPDAGTFTRLGFSMAGAFSANLYNPPYFVDFPLDSNGNIRNDVFSKWKSHNPADFFVQKTSSLSEVENLAIYFDCGRQDELHIFEFNTAFNDTLEQLGLDFVFQPFNGGHFNKLIKRVNVSFAFLDSVMNSTIVAVNDQVSGLPQSFVLHQNYPNPFNLSTYIEFSLSRSIFVTLKVYNIYGQVVHVVVSDRLSPGNFKYQWNANGLANGVYYYRLQAGSSSQTKKLILLK